MSLGFFFLTEGNCDKKKNHGNEGKTCKVILNWEQAISVRDFHELGKLKSDLLGEPETIFPLQIMTLTAF